MAAIQIPASVDWPAFEPKPSDYKLKVWKEDWLPNTVVKFVDWEANLRLHLDAYDLMHHLDTKDKDSDAIPEGNEGGDAEKATVKRIRTTNRKRVFLYIHQHCIKGTEAGNAAADKTYTNRPRTLLHALRCFYGVQSLEMLKDLKAKFKEFRQKPNETIENIYKRFTMMIKELEDQGYSPTDAKRRKRFIAGFKNAEWDLIIDKEEDMYDKDKKGPPGHTRTFLETYQSMKEQELRTKLRQKGRVDLSNPNHSSAMSAKEEKATLKKLALKYPKIAQANAVIGARGGGAPRGGGGRGGRGGARGIVPPGLITGAAKKVHAPPQCCFNCGEPGHKTFGCPSKAMGQTALGKTKRELYEDYKVRCAAAGEHVFCIVEEEEESSSNCSEAELLEEMNVLKAKELEQSDIFDKMKAEFNEKMLAMENQRKEILKRNNLAMMTKAGRNYLVNDTACTNTMTPQKRRIKNQRVPKPARTVATATGQRENIPLEGEFYVSPYLPPMEGASYIPQLKHTLLSVEQAITTWDATAIFLQGHLVYVKGRVTYDESQVICRGFQRNGLWLTDMDNPTAIPDDLDQAFGCEMETVGDEKLDVVKEEEEEDFCEFVALSDEFTDGKICEIPAPNEEKETIPVRTQQRKRKKARIDMMRKYYSLYRLWHARFGHKAGLRRTIMYQGVIGLPKDYGKLRIENDFCVDCLRGKQKKSKHVRINRRKRKVGVLVHMDTQQQPIHSWDGKLHTLTFVEHESKVDIPSHLKLKSDVSDQAVRKLKWLKTVTGNKCKELQVDGAGEFIGANTVLRAYCEDKGITYRISVRMTPQSNGVAEAYNLVRTSCSITMRKSGKTPDIFFPESDRHASLIDSGIVKDDETISGFEKLYGYRLDCELFKAWGCHGFAYIPIEIRNKFADHTRPCIYMGVAEEYDAYNLYDPVAKEFFPSDSCVFDEFSYGFKELMDRVTGNPHPSLNLREHLLTVSDWGNMNYDLEAWTDHYEDSDTTSVFDVPAKRMITHEEDIIPPIQTSRDFAREQTITIDPETPEKTVPAKRRLRFEDSPRQDVTIEDDDDLWTNEHSPEMTMRDDPGTPALNIPVSDVPKSALRVRTPEKQVVTLPKSPGKPISWRAPVVEAPKVEPQRKSMRLMGPEKARYYGKPTGYVELMEAMGQTRSEAFAAWETDTEKVRCYNAITHLSLIMQHEKEAHAKLCPGSYRQAVNGKDSIEWVSSMAREIYAHTINGTWTLVPRPQQGSNGKKHIVMRSVWKYRIKMQQLVIVNYKSRLCADGSIVKDEPSNVFAGTPIPNAINTTFALAAHNGVTVHSGDIPAAYVQAPVPDGDTVYYIEQPQGFKDLDHPDWVCRLNKCLYGIPCSGKQWNMTLARFLTEELHMKRLDSDPSVFFKYDKRGYFIMPCVVDDTLDMSTSPELRKEIHDAMIKKFRWKDLGPTTWYLGMRVVQTYREITIDQTAYLQEMLLKFGQLQMKKHDTPMIPGEFLEAPREGEDTTNFPYQSVVGSLIWLCKTRPDISFPVSQCARYMSNHVERHDRAATRILGYLWKNPNWAIGFDVNQNPDGGPVTVEIETDSSWADVRPIRFSSYGYNTYVNGWLVAWRCRRTPDVCTSSAEAEYNAYAEGSKECCFMKSFMDEINVIIREAIKLRGDSKSADALASQWSVSQRTKHMEVRLHFVRHSIMGSKKHILERIGTLDNSADMHTKALSNAPFRKCRGRTMRICHDA
jgi:hypothetical protein